MFVSTDKCTTGGIYNYRMAAVVKVCPQESDLISLQNKQKNQTAIKKPSKIMAMYSVTVETAAGTSTDG